MRTDWLIDWFIDQPNTHLELFVFEGVFDVENVRFEGVFGADFSFGDFVFFGVFLSLIHHPLDVLLRQPTLMGGEH